LRFSEKRCGKGEVKLAFCKLTHTDLYANIISWYENQYVGTIISKYSAHDGALLKEEGDD